MTPVLALIGMNGLWLLFLWLLSGMAGQYLSVRKGYGEKPGVAAGLLLLPLGVLLWLVWPAKEGSAWKQDGAFPKRHRDKGIDTLDEQAAPKPGGPDSAGQG